MDSAAWVGVKEAAQRLGCTEKTIRRRIQGGSLVSRSIPIPGGTRYEVQLDSTADRPSPKTARKSIPRSIPSPVDSGELVKIVAILTEETHELRRELVSKAEAAAMWQARAEMLAGQLALQAPRSMETVQESAPMAHATPEAAGRPWWRFW